MRARRQDDNHSTIRRLLRDVGAEVLDLHTLPGALDLLVGWRGVFYLVELKDGAKSTSRRKLTPAEQATIARFRAVGCPVVVAESGDDVLRAIGAM